jgi:hypothetical protein
VAEGAAAEAGVAAEAAAEGDGRLIADVVRASLPWALIEERLDDADEARGIR